MKHKPAATYLRVIQGGLSGEEMCRTSATCSKVAHFPEAEEAAFTSLGNPPIAEENGCPGLPNKSFSNLCPGTS